MSKTLQSPALTATEAHHVANLTCQTLERIRDDKSYGLLWEKALQLQRDLDVDDPVLPRMRKTPRRHEIGSGKVIFIVHPKITSKYTTMKLLI